VIWGSLRERVVRELRKLLGDEKPKKKRKKPKLERFLPIR
jgi:hypothetical protein